MNSAYEKEHNKKNGKCRECSAGLAAYVERESGLMWEKRDLFKSQKAVWKKLVFSLDIQAINFCVFSIGVIKSISLSLFVTEAI